MRWPHHPRQRDAPRGAGRGRGHQIGQRRAVQLRELEENRDRLLTDAQQERSLAQSEAADTLASARRESDQLRLAAQQEATELRGVIETLQPHTKG